MNDFQLCPKFEKGMKMLGKRWTGLIINQLLLGPQRFSHIKAELPISGKLLTERLKEMEEEELVTRKVYAEVPVRVEYELTEKGKALKPVMKEISKWAEEWVELTEEN
ncbi:MULTISPECIES: winged helix-turn-helix transcriptional regulator [Bacillaceae]|uniref:HxlR family transcriptional regulator n=1 Tax=Pseudobacillus wudalianchiensis TaxID=1743143 RepID=A0A1B9ABL8_9BACI|nr:MULTISPECIES: helix-turn-helix domain-containing protein [Bacillus]KMY55332.1 HxlR family transcriptional regulator [Bacillus sp. FJAT-27231]OCA81237.1 HxlR family transcriptional regulator [Bacillus wudalianchiensis]